MFAAGAPFCPPAGGLGAAALGWAAAGRRREGRKKKEGDIFGRSARETGAGVRGVLRAERRPGLPCFSVRRVRRETERVPGAERGTGEVGRSERAESERRTDCEKACWARQREQ